MAALELPALPAPADPNAAAASAVSTAVATVAVAVEATAPAPAAAPVAPIIIKKIYPHAHAAHGGAWKIALADMMTAMMAFFLLMWILGSTNDEQRKSIADYFKPTSESRVTNGKLSGSGKPFGGESILSKQGMPKPPMQNGARDLTTPQSEGGAEDSDKSAAADPSNLSDEDKRRIAEEADAAAFEKLEQGIRDKLAQNKRLDGLQDQVKFVREKEGLRIEIIDKADFSMFTSGTSQLMPRAEQLIGEVAASLKGMPNKLALRGHTDAVQFADGAERNNWQLSAERAESTRQAVARKGVPPDRFAKLEGVADTLPFIKGDPSDPRNRRISITVLHQ